MPGLKHLQKSVASVLPFTWHWVAVYLAFASGKNFFSLQRNLKEDKKKQSEFWRVSLKQSIYQFLLEIFFFYISEVEKEREKWEHVS